MEARTLSVLRRRVGAVKGARNSGGGPVAGGRTTPSALPMAPPAPHRSAQQPAFPSRSDRDRLPGRHRLLSRTSLPSGPIMLIGLQLLNAWSFAGIAGIGLPLFQQMIPRPGLSTGLYMNPPDRLYRVRPHHRDRLAHRARATRHLPHQRRPHSDRTDHHHHRQPNNNQASPERSEGPRVHWRLNSGFPTSTVVSRLGSWVSA
jgi:hypothetical protein